MRKKEQIKKIRGYGGRYGVSDRGYIISYIGKDRVLTGTETLSGYRVTLYKKDGTSRKEYVHILVANAFIPKVKGKNIVCHINGDKTNNKAKNLKRVSKAELNKIHKRSK